MNPKTPLVSFQNVSIRSDSTTPSSQESWLFKDFSWVLPAGELYTITGFAGSGKTTLLHLIHGVRYPEKGSVCFSGRAWTSLTGRERTRLYQTIGTVFEDDPLFPGLSVFENVTLAAACSRQPAEETLRVAHDMMRWTRLDRWYHASVETLGSSQAMWLRLARAVVMRPRLLLIDNVFGALDPETHERVLVLLESLVAHNTTVVMTVYPEFHEKWHTTHNLGTVVNLSPVARESSVTWEKAA